MYDKEKPKMYKKEWKKDDFKVIKAPCGQCGKEVLVPENFHGCVLCGKCSTPKSWTLTGKGRVIRK